ncbi:MAG TPA: hypothetical protein DCW60_02185, partial [Sutterella sp.]|nr:hypothetical protein [Sutterella sp.]
GLIVLSGLEKTEGPHEVWVLTSGALTPETEVLGAALSEIKTQIAPEHLILFADLRELVSRFAHLPERIESRKELYERFALESGVRVFFHTGAPFEETLLTALRETLAQGPQ